MQSILEVSVYAPRLRRHPRGPLHLCFRKVHLRDYVSRASLDVVET
jgi:hypothetical protein